MQVRSHNEDCQWCFPKAGGRTTLKNVFSKKREEANVDFLKSGASELLVAYPCFRHFIQAKVPRPGMEKQIDSMMVLLEVCDLIEKAMKETRLDKLSEIAHKLAFAAKTHLDAFQLAYAAELVRIKHHELQHLAPQVLRDIAKARLDTCIPCTHPCGVNRCMRARASAVSTALETTLRARPPFLHSPGCRCLLELLDRGAQER